ncbi:MAG: hypothetical protein AAGL89_16815 [Pseudomonadota bacterium]
MEQLFQTMMISGVVAFLIAVGLAAIFPRMVATQMGIGMLITPVILFFVLWLIYGSTSDDLLGNAFAVLILGVVWAPVGFVTTLVMHLFNKAAEPRADAGSIETGDET